jgi:hypothetical protein
VIGARLYMEVFHCMSEEIRVGDPGAGVDITAKNIATAAGGF